MLALSCVTKLGANEKSLSGILEYWKSLGFINYTVCVCACRPCVCLHACAQKKSADVFCRKRRKGCRQWELWVNPFLTHKKTHHRFQIKSGSFFFFFWESLHKTLRGIDWNGFLKLSFYLCKYKVCVFTPWKSATVNWLLLTTHENHEEEKLGRRFLISSLFFCLSEIILCNFSWELIRLQF